MRALQGDRRQEGSVLLSDSYAAYSHYAEATGVTHAQCWSHTRRGYFEALAAEPQAADQALKMIANIYQVEAEIRQRALSGQNKRVHRLEHAKQSSTCA